MNYEEVKVRAKKYHKSAVESAKEKYHYARGKGFGSYESVVLMGHSTEDIDRIAKERDDSKLGK